MNVSAYVCVRASVLANMCIFTCVTAYVYVPMCLYASGYMYVWWFVYENECLLCVGGFVYKQRQNTVSTKCILQIQATKAQALNSAFKSNRSFSE